jgi:Rps23 Pro-64 3,4-dihydroxylase Tpa1-like proline 4-hydroxylase
MNWVNPVYLKNVDGLRKQFPSNKPFPHLVLGNFFAKRINSVAKALVKEKFYENNSDLFQFQQTDDCKNAKQPAVKEFYKFFSSKEFINLISKITNTKLKFIDMSGFIYDDSDYLLPHDDRLSGRKIAYVVNLSKDFTPSDGGALQFFKGNKIVKTIPPTFNTLTIFKVSPKSLHQVQEVMSNKKRLTFAGWFHG